MAVAAFRACDLAGLARVDFLMEPDGKQRIYLNEVNTLPGFTQISMYPKLWEATGIKYSDLITRLIELALERQRKRSGTSIVGKSENRVVRCPIEPTHLPARRLLRWMPKIPKVIILAAGTLTPVPVPCLILDHEERAPMTLLDAPKFDQALARRRQIVLYGSAGTCVRSDLDLLACLRHPVIGPGTGIPICAAAIDGNHFLARSSRMTCKGLQHLDSRPTGSSTRRSTAPILLSLPS